MYRLQINLFVSIIHAMIEFVLYQYRCNYLDVDVYLISFKNILTLAGLWCRIRVAIRAPRLCLVPVRRDFVSDKTQDK